MNAQDIAYQVSLTLGDHADDYDIDGIVEDIVQRYGRVDIDTIPGDAYWAIVNRHDITATTYTRRTGEGTETTTIHRDGDEIREVYVCDGTTLDDTVVYDGDDPEEYLRRRDMELRGEGYTA